MTPAAASRRLLPGLTVRTLPREILAGVTLIAISVPLNIGYAQIAGLPATAGLYALVLPSLVFALTASTRQVVVAPDAAAAALVASSLGGVAVAGSGGYLVMAAAQAVIGGGMLLLAARLRLGFLADFLSHPILVGFIGGLALEIMLSQLGKMTGISLGDGEFLHKLVTLVQGLPTVNLVTVALSLSCLAVLITGRLLAPGIPWALVVLVGATLASVLMDLPGRGVDVLGHIEAGPPALAFPMLSLAEWVTLIPSALALSAITMAEGLGVARRYAEGGDAPHSPNRDLAAYGLANIAAGLSSSFTVGSSTSRTAAMAGLGSRSQLPSVVLAAGSLLLILFGTSLLEPIPSPALGAIIAVAVFGLLGLGELPKLWRMSRYETGIALLCAVGVLAVGPIAGLLLAFVLALIHLVARASRPALVVLADPGEPEASLLLGAPDREETRPGVAVIRVNAPIFFANSETIATRIRHAAGSVENPRAVVLDLEGVSDIDVTGAGRLRSAFASVASLGGQVAVSRMSPQLRGLFARYELLDQVQEFDTNREALAALSTEEPQ